MPPRICGFVDMTIDGANHFQFKVTQRSRNDLRMTKVINVVHVGSTSWLSSVQNMDLEVCSYADCNGVNDMSR